MASLALSGGVVKKRLQTGGRIVGAGCVLTECVNTDSRVVVAGRVVHERVITQERVDIAEVAALLTDRSRLRHKRRAGEGEWNEQQNEPERRAIHRMF